MREFLLQHAVFTVGDLHQYLLAQGSGNIYTQRSLLAYYCNKGQILPIRRGVYATVPLGVQPTTHLVDPYLIAAKLAPDAVLAYHTALAFHGKAYAMQARILYTSCHQSLPLHFQSYEIKRVSIPRPLRKGGEEMFGVTPYQRSGVAMKVTNFERTFVDVLDRPDLGGTWEEIWRSLESIEFLDLDQVLTYTGLLANATTAAKVGFFLEQHKEAFMVEESTLRQLQKLCPRQPHYLVRRKRKDCRWVARWHLMVPAELIHKTWGEVL